MQADAGAVGYQEGSLSSIGIFSNPLSQLALLDPKICASGLSGISLFRLPAGTSRVRFSICTRGSAYPQIEQKHRPCLVDGKLNDVILSWPEIHFKLADEENRFAA